MHIPNSFHLVWKQKSNTNSRLCHKNHQWLDILCKLNNILENTMVMKAVHYRSLKAGWPLSLPPLPPLFSSLLFSPLLSSPLVPFPSLLISFILSYLILSYLIFSPVPTWGHLLNCRRKILEGKQRWFCPSHLHIFSSSHVEYHVFCSPYHDHESIITTGMVVISKTRRSLWFSSIFSWKICVEDI